MTWNNGDIYIGEWKNDNKEGDGIFWEKKEVYLKVNGRMIN